MSSRSPLQQSLCTQLAQRFRMGQMALADFSHHWLPLANQLAARDKPYILGLNGAQGSGKSTLAACLQAILGQEYGLQVATLSLDDLYYPKVHRQWLAREVHPLLATRGVPGTHDVTLGLELVRRCRAGQALSLPRFDKASDDRSLEPQWLEGPIDLLILEGWCLGADPQSEQQLAVPVNDLEAREDMDGTWRRYVNQCLGGEYQRLFDQLDSLLMLAAPDWSTVIQWRAQQESQLKKTRGQGMDESQLAHFMLYYQRLTELQLNKAPQRVDCLYRLDKHRHIHEVVPKGEQHDWQI
ncbi:kinase [Bowmanella dokdonensis]|uniref:Kinase n=1 Tax=Bowmanella dokdonensis TaxID=751969 RepID=A0A939DJH4_9ALTE|nr:kinase [Bowmanella dokdonensis]MBN7823848.1 kinase [Bowmanella dokdonensis]